MKQITAIPKWGILSGEGDPAGPPPDSGSEGSTSAS